MAITRVGQGSSSANNGGDVILTLPAMLEGDCVVVAGAWPRTGGTGAPIPSGYSTADDYDDGVLEGAVSYKFMGATPDATVTVPGSTAGTDAITAIFFVLRGVDPTTPLDATPTRANDATGATAGDPASITTVTDGAWVLPFIMRALQAVGSNVASAGPAGYSNLESVGRADTNRSSTSGSTLEKATAGAEDPGAYAFSGTTTSWLGITTAWRPAATGGGTTGSLSASGGGSASTTGAKGAQADLSASSDGSASEDGAKGAEGNISASVLGGMDLLGAKGAATALAASAGGAILINGIKGAAGILTVSGGGDAVLIGTAGAGVPTGQIVVTGGGSISLSGTASRTGVLGVSGNGSIVLGVASSRTGLLLISGGGDAELSGAVFVGPPPEPPPPPTPENFLTARARKLELVGVRYALNRNC